MAGLEGWLWFCETAFGKKCSSGQDLKKRLK
jgi:hypothetical protein